MQNIFGILETNQFILQRFDLLAKHFHLNPPQATVISFEILHGRKSSVKNESEYLCHYYLKDLIEKLFLKTYTL